MGYFDVKKTEAKAFFSLCRCRNQCDISLIQGHIFLHNIKTKR